MKAPAHLNALRAFEASARHQSFAGAASELNVTPAAVGQLVRTLEDWLGSPLFVRTSRGRTRLQPTEAASAALADIRAGLDRLGVGLDRLRAGARPGVLTVTVSPAFAAKWLLPRIERFYAACPDIDLRLDTSPKALDFIAHQIDIGVRYGAGQWPGLEALHLLDEEVFPVCAPAFLAQGAPLDQPSDLARRTLVHDLTMDAAAGFPTWATWWRAAGLRGAPPQRGLKVNDSAAVLQAAMEGHGVALARSVMVEDDLRSQRLTRLFPDVRAPSPLAYYLVQRPECASMPRLAAFRDWMRAEAAR